MDSPKPSQMEKTSMTAQDGAASKLPASKPTSSHTITRIPGLRIYGTPTDPGFDSSIQPEIDISELETFPVFDSDESEEMSLADIKPELATRSDIASMAGTVFAAGLAAPGAESATSDTPTKGSGEKNDKYDGINVASYVTDVQSNWTLPLTDWDPDWAEDEPSTSDESTEVDWDDDEERGRGRTGFYGQGSLPNDYFTPLEAARHELDLLLTFYPVRRYPSRVPSPITVPEGDFGAIGRPVKSVETPKKLVVADKPPKRASPPSKLREELRLREDAPSPVVEVRDLMRVWRLRDTLDASLDGW